MKFLDMSPEHKKKILDNCESMYKSYLKTCDSEPEAEKLFFINGDIWSNNVLYKRWINIITLILVGSI